MKDSDYTGDTCTDEEHARSLYPEADANHIASLERDGAFDKPWSAYTGLERTVVRQRFRHGEEWAEMSAHMVRGHEADWQAQEDAKVPVHRRRHVLVLRIPSPRKPREKGRGEFTRALVHLCATSHKRAGAASGVVD